MITKIRKTATPTVFGEGAVSRSDMPLFVNKTNFIEAVRQFKEQDCLSRLRTAVLDLQSNLRSVKADKIGVLNINGNGDTVKVSLKLSSQKGLL
jgi:hypothetical protein